jgi:hypothetical protein
MPSPMRRIPRMWSLVVVGVAALACSLSVAQDSSLWATLVAIGGVVVGCACIGTAIALKRGWAV